MLLHGNDAVILDSMSYQLVESVATLVVLIFVRAWSSPRIDIDDELLQWLAMPTNLIFMSLYFVIIKRKTTICTFERT